MDDLIRRSDAVRAVSEPYNENLWDNVYQPISNIVNILKSLPAVEPCKDAVSRQWLLDYFGLSEKTRKHGGDYSGYDTRMLYEIQDAIEDAPSVTVETDIDDYMKGYGHGMADAWKIAQTVFGSTVTMYEAMDVAKCMKGVEDETY